MDFWEVINKRHCCRKFNPNKEVDDSLIEKIIKAGESAPSAGGFKSARFTVLKGNKKDELTKVIPERMWWFKDAPVALVIWSDPKETVDYFKERGEKLYIIQDSGAAAENIFLAVTALGLSTCWIGTLDQGEKTAEELLGLQSNQKAMAVMPIGYSL